MSILEFNSGQQQEKYKEKPYLVGLFDIRKVYPQVDGLLEELENFDQTTFQHSLRAESFAWNLATELGFKEEDRRTFCLAAVLHDTGKEVLDKELLNKQPFKKEDIDKVKPHVIASFKKVYDICPDAAEIILRHHSFQKDSYPSDEEISRYSKIDDPVKLSKIEKMAELLSMVDVFETRSGRRPGKEPETLKKFLPDLHKQFGSRGDNKAIRILIKTLGKEKIIKNLNPLISKNMNLKMKHDLKGLRMLSKEEADPAIEEWKKFGYDINIEERRPFLLAVLSESEKERLNEIEEETEEMVKDIKNLPEVQRLFFLLQLGGTAERAQQTRHSHSELDAELAKFAGVKLQLPIEDIKILIASAWLHDVGHAALCHVSDPVLEKHGYGNHEERTVRTIADKIGAIYKILQEHDIDPNRVIETIEEKGYLGTIQSVSDTLSYLIIDSMAVRKPIFEDQGAGLISNLRGIDKERGLLIVKSPELWRQVLEKRAEMMRDVYLYPLNRRNRAATRVLIEIAAKYKCIPLEKIVKGTDMNIELNLQSLVQFDPGAALLSDKTGNDPILEDYNNILGLRYGPVDSDEWETKMFETKGEMSEYLTGVIPRELIMEALEQTVIISPFDYTQKKITVLPEGSENPVTLKAEGVELGKEDTQYTVYIPRKFMKENYAERKQEASQKRKK